jgi:hypothetical protein
MLLKWSFTYPSTEELRIIKNKSYRAKLYRLYLTSYTHVSYELSITEICIFISNSSERLNRSTEMRAVFSSWRVLRAHNSFIATKTSRNKPQQETNESSNSKLNTKNWCVVYSRDQKLLMWARYGGNWNKPHKLFSPPPPRHEAEFCRRKTDHNCH